MSNSDSFIDEVTDEVKRDRLYAQMRKYGPIAVAVVLAIVGGAAWTEYRSAQDQARAEAAGDAIFDALEETDAEARAAVFADLPIEGDATAIAALMAASSQVDAGELDSAASILTALAADDTAPEMYRDLAALKAAMLPNDDTAAKIAALEPLARPGQPYYLLAMEQIAYANLEGGDTDAAIAVFRQIEEDAASSRGLRERVQNLMIALGEPMPEPVAQ
ncbi:tetratricopeptide repeat protein [Yoonia maritima]|uniref:tetratricopeptide repeat protein n=1 Tax=Yoonia maritima TaxID=1435347 RepID=UPI000D10D5BE|nr:tetratricopeptide repeat protein [Yoonia maritima]